MSVTKVILPKLGLTMDEGRIVAWRKREGDAVAAGEAIFEVETDKVTMEVESPAAGYLRRIIVPDDETVPVTTVVGIVADTLDEPIDAAMPATNAAPATPASSFGSSPPTPGPAGASAPVGDRVPASPAARKRAAELGLDLVEVRGSGPGGRIQTLDVERAAAERRH